MDIVTSTHSDQSDRNPVYRDFASIAEQDWDAASTMKNDNFPAKLHYVLSDMEKEGLQHIAAWQTHGRCFFVHDKKRFTQQILPFWFRQSKFDSFQRQLNIYGFVRITSGADKGGYYHELFLRGRIFLTTRIQRNKTRRTSSKSAQQQAHEHNLDLYRFPALLPSGTNRDAKQNCVSASHLSNMKQNDEAPSSALQISNNFQPSFSMKAPNLSTNEVSTPTIRELEFGSSTLPWLKSCTMETTTTTTTWPQSPQVMMSTYQLSLVDLMLVQLLNSHQDSTPPTSEMVIGPIEPSGTTLVHHRKYIHSAPPRTHQVQGSQ